MPALPEHIIFFDENTILADKWGLERAANASRRLLPSTPGHRIFIKLDDYIDSHLYFLVVLACTPNLPLCVWKSTVIDEGKDPQFECVSIKE